MFQIANSDIRVSILDPIIDRDRLGSRYCVGGYIWQVEDIEKGPLFAGPRFPDPEPAAWDGQGCPEVFEIALNQNKAKVGEDVYVIGVGRVLRESPVKPFHVRNNFTVKEFAPWSVDHGPTVCQMTSRQKFQDWDFTLTRRVSLEGRTLNSTTHFKNHGQAELPVRWFAHPFFPLAGYASSRFSVDCDLIRYVPEAGGFRFNAQGIVERIPEYNWTKGCFQLLNLPFGFPLDFYQRHPLLGEIKIECSFPVAWMPIWANDRTISIEPYLHNNLKSNSEMEWSIRYVL